MRKISFLMIILFLLFSSNMSSSAETENTWIYSNTEKNLSFQWNLEGLPSLPAQSDFKNSFWVPTPERPTNVTVNLKIPTNIFSDVPFNIPTHIENKNGELELINELSNPMNDESININIILNQTILFSERISEEKIRTSGDIYTISDGFLALNNKWKINFDSIYQEKFLDFSQNLQMNISRYGSGEYENSDQLHVSCLLIPKEQPWSLGYYDGTTYDNFPDLREIPLDQFVVTPDGNGFLSKGAAYDNITLSKKNGSAVKIKKALNGSMLQIIPDKPLEFDTEYELTMPKDSISGINFNYSSLDEKGEVPTTTISFNTQSVIKTSYILGYESPMSVEKATPLKLKFESIMDNVKISKITIASTNKFTNSLFAVLENNAIVSEPSMTYKNVGSAEFDFNQINMSLWQREFVHENSGYFYNPYYETLTALIEVNQNGEEKTIKLPIQIKADSLYNITVMDSGLGMIGISEKGQVLLGDKPLEERVPYKILEPNIPITLPAESKIIVKFIDGTVGSIKMSDSMAREEIRIKPITMKLEPMVDQTEFKNKNSWIAKWYGILESEVKDKVIDKTVSFIFKNPTIANPVGFAVGIFASPDRINGSIIYTRIRSSVGFSLNEKKGITFSNFEGTPEIILDNREKILVPENNQIVSDKENYISGKFSEIDKESNIYKLNEEIISDLEILDQPSFTYVCSNGIVIESFSKYWWDDKKLEDLYQELLNNDHGDEINSLKSIKIYPDKGFFHERGRTMGYYVPDKMEIHLNFGDINTTVDSVARTLSHEYGHHYTIQLCKEKENVILGETAISKAPYSVARNLTDNNFVKNNYDNSHAWNIRELAANDYVQLLGSEKANNLSNDRVQENPMIPIASDVPGLENYFRKLGNLPDKVEDSLKKPILTATLVENGESGYRNLKFSWDSIAIDSPVSYMLRKVKENNIYPNYTVEIIEDSTLENFEITDFGTIVPGETTYILYCRDKKRNTVSSNLVTVTAEYLENQKLDIKIK